MILITRSGGFTFIFLFSIFSVSLLILVSLFIFFLANPNPLGRTISWLSCVCPVLAAGEHVLMGKKF